MRFFTAVRKTKRSRRAGGLLAVSLLVSALPAGAADDGTTLAVSAASTAPAAAVGAKPFIGFVPGQSVEDVSKRTAQSKTFRNPDGTYTAQISSDVVHYWTGTGWAEISNRLVPDGPGSYRNEANSFTVRFGAADVVLDTPQGAMNLGPSGASLRAPVLDPVGETVTYADVWPGVDVRYRVVSTGVKEEIVVRRRPTISQFPFRLQGAAMTVQADGSVAMGGAFAGTWRIPAPQVFAKDGQLISKTGARFTVTGNTITLNVDRSWLAGLDETKDLPVVLDPPILSVGSTTGRSYERLSSDTDYGTCDSIPTPCQVMVGIRNTTNGWHPWRSVQYFPYESLYGKQILKGQVILQARQEGTPDPKVMKIYGDDVNGQFGGVWNWVNLGGFIASGTAQDDTFIYDEAESGPHPLADYYQDLVNRNLPGMAIKFLGDETPGNSTFKRFAWFQLQLTYNTPPNVPDTLSQTWSSGFTAPELSARFTDPDGDNGNVDFEVTRPDGSKLLVPVGTTNGGTARTTPAVSAAGTYSWHVRAWDGRTLSRNPEWSSDQTFTVITDVAPNVPDNLAPDNNAASASAPTLSARYTANDGQGGWIEFDLGSEDQVILVPAAHNQTVSFTPDTLMEGNYSWRVRATDGTYESAWTPWRYFNVRKNLVWYENFTGNNGDLWNSSRWSTGTNSLTRTVDIQSNEGRLYVNGSSAGATARQAGSNINLADIDVALTFRFENTNTRSFLRLRARDSGTNAYRVELRNDSTTVKLQNILNGVSGAITQFTYNPDGQAGFDPGSHRLRVQLTGSTVRVKAWPANSAEPDTWQIDRTDTSVTGPGVLKIDHNYDTGSRSIYLDDVAVANLQVQGGTQPELKMWDEYPNHGYADMARVTDGGTLLGFTSDRCKAVENDLIAQVKATTEGSQPEFRGAWPSGLILHRGSDCIGRVGDGVHITLDYMTDSEWTQSGPGHGKNGGHVHSFLAAPEWCDVHGYTKINGRCGLEFSRVHLKESKFDTVYPNDTVRRNVLIHETGHAFGFKDDCSTKAITNDGSCGLPQGWTSIDRREMRDHIYTNFPYP
ncbi:MAG: hypothetical protein LC750_09240 [Actinobacteria bacterium]|nr:hypothetical protein [Actinomycetota bacterium]